MNQIKQAFTLVELIVVVTILAILATIGFVSYSGYLTGVRDTNRVASLTAISDGLELYRTKNDLPLPDNSVEVQVESETIARQGYAGSNVLQTIEYSKAGKDPKDDQYYSYYLTDDKKHYQMMAFLEESDNLETNIITQVNAATDYSNRHPKVYGKRLGILTDDDNTPIQEITTIKTVGSLNMTAINTQSLIARMSDREELSGTGVNVISGVISSKVGKNYTSCEEIRNSNTIAQNVDGIYSIKINGTDIKVYCDMKNGGWMLLIKAIKGAHDYFISGNLGSSFADAQFNSLDTYKMSDETIKALKDDRAIFKIELYDTDYQVENQVYIELQDIKAFDSTVRSDQWSNTHMKGANIYADLAALPYDTARDWPNTCGASYGPNKGYSACHNTVHIGYKTCSPRGFGNGASCSNNGTWQNERAGKLWIK